MRITDLEVDGFGIWNGLQLHGLAEHVHVFYGPNEAGKTTLLQFVRSIFYGFNTQHRNHYLSQNRVVGGSIRIIGAQGPFVISRHTDELHGPPAGRLSVSGADGHGHSEQLLAKLLSNVDEQTFNNVFALGLDELQELATLRDTDAAQYLFNLTAGLDRISLPDIERELSVSRARILGSADEPGQAGQLRRERDRLRAKIQDCDAVQRRYARLTQEREAINQEITGLEADVKSLQERIRVIEIATTLRDTWNERKAVEAELAQFGDCRPIPADGLARLDHCNVRIEARRQALTKLKQEQRRLKSEAAKLPVNDVLTRLSPRVAILGEQRDWVAVVEKDVESLTAEANELDRKLRTEHEQLGLPADSALIATVHHRSLAPLSPLAHGVRSARARRDQAQRDLEQQRTSTDVQDKQLRAALNERPEGDLAKSLERVGNQVSILRRRVQVEDRLGQMTRHEAELEEQSRRLIDRQLLPVPALIAIGSPFVLGVLLTLIGLFLPESITGSYGWLMAALGLIGTSVAVGLKIAMERTAARQFETCRKQLEMLALQISQAREEREKLDAQIPPGGGPLVTRLQAAEAELASLEQLLPLDAQRQVARQSASAATTHAKQAESDYQAARKRWRQALAVLGLPENWTPAQVQQFRERAERIGEMRRRLERCRQDIAERQKSLQGLTQRIADLAREAGLNGRYHLVSQQLEHLHQLTADNQELVTRRDSLLKECAQRRREERRHRRWIARWQQRRKKLLRAAGAADEQEFRRRGELQLQVTTLSQRRESLAREIAAGCGEWCSEETLAQLLTNTSVAALDQRWEELTACLQSVERSLREQFERRGTLNHEIKTLVEDRSLEHAQLELAQIDQRLREALTRWQVLSVASTVLSEIRRIYEAEKQPETLLKASAYLKLLTDGRYARVWAPLGEHILRVDDSDGNSLLVEHLSRGAREQLFLSLRLALVNIFAGRGITLPVVLDDILVNFDTRRARAAAVVLRNFAAQGHQLLIFTCHEHILKLFHSIKAVVQRLPERSNGSVVSIAEPEPEPESIEPPVAAKVQPSPAPRPKRRKRPVARTRRRSEVAVGGDSQINAELIASASRRLRRIDPPELMPEPLSVEEDENRISWADAVEEFHFEATGNPEFPTDVDDYDSLD